MKRANLHVAHEIEQRRLAHIRQAHYAHFQIAFHAAEAAGRLLYRGCDCFGGHCRMAVGDTHAEMLFSTLIFPDAQLRARIRGTNMSWHGACTTPVVPPSASCQSHIM